MNKIAHKIKPAIANMGIQLEKELLGIETILKIPVLREIAKRDLQIRKLHRSSDKPALKTIIHFIVFTYNLILEKQVL